MRVETGGREGTIFVDRRWEMNEDAMATEMLSGGIRAFAKDLNALGDIVRQRLA